MDLNFLLCFQFCMCDCVDERTRQPQNITYNYTPSSATNVCMVLGQVKNRTLYSAGVWLFCFIYFSLQFYYLVDIDSFSCDCLSV